MIHHSSPSRQRHVLLEYTHKTKDILFGFEVLENMLCWVACCPAPPGGYRWAVTVLP